MPHAKGNYIMQIDGPAKAVGIFVGESDQWHGRPLYAAIVEKARAEGLAGATVTRGLMGFGANSRIHTASILRLSEDLPVVVQIIDSPARIAAFLPLIHDMVAEGLVISFDVHVERYVHHDVPPAGGADA
jgi:PII-like signaling protein